MPFNPTTAVAVNRRDDGLLEKDNFDASTAVPIPQISEGEKRFVPELSDQERGRAFAEYVALEKGEKMSTGKKVMWTLTSEKARAGVTAIINTLLTGGLYPAVQAARGAVDDTGDYSLFDRVTRGVLYPEETERFTDRMAVKNEPEWAKITRSVSEDIVAYGVAGFAKGAMKQQLLARDIARKIDTAAESYATEKVGSVSPKTGTATEEASVLMTKIRDVKEGYKRAIITKLKSIDVATGKTGVQEYAERRSIIGLIGDEVDNLSVSSKGFGSGGLNFKVGQKVSFKNPEGREIVGQISKLVGNSAEIDLAGRTIIATLSQLRVPTEELRKEAKEVFGQVIVESVEKQLGQSPNPSQLKAFIREQTGQNQESKQLLGYLKEKYAEQIKAGEFEAEIEQKLATPLKASEVKVVVREQTGQVKEQGGMVTEKTAFIQSMKDRVKAAKQAEKMSKEEVFDTQTAFIDMVNKSGLEPKDRAKFIDVIRKIQTGEDLTKAMKPSLYESGPRAGQIKDIGLEEKINQLIETAEKKKIVSDIKKVLKKSEESESIAIDYAQAIQKVVEGFDFSGRSEGTIKQLKATADFIKKQVAQGEDVTMPKSVMKKLDILSKKPIDEVSNEELKKLLEDVQTLEKLGKTKQALKESAYANKKENIKQQILPKIKEINSKQVEKVPIGSNPDKWAERYVGLMNYLNKTRVGLTPIEGLADITGMQDMKIALDKSFSKYLEFNDKNIKDWYELTKNFNEGNFDRIGVYAIAKQEGGVERLANSGITQKEIDSIKLSPDELKAYEFLRATFDKYYPDVKNYAKEVYNADVGKVDNYVSFMADNDAMNDLEIYDKFGARPESAITGKMTKTVEQGFTKGREKISTAKLETNIDKIFRRHLDDVAYMLTMGKDIKMFYEIVNSPDMREALGDVGSLAWLQYLDLMARKGGAEGAKRIEALDFFRRNMAAGVLGFRLSSMLVQLSSFGDTMATIGAEWATKGATAIATSPEWRNFIMDNFPEIREAVGDDIAFREFGEDFLGKLSNLSMKPLQMLDGVMRSTAAAGTYQKVAAQRGVKVDLKNPDKSIIEEATKIVRQSQGSSFFKDQPLSLTTGYGLAENRSLNKMILTFQSFMLGRWDNINRQIWRLGIKEKNYSKAIMSTIWLLVFGIAGAIVARRTAKAITGVKKDKKKDKTFGDEFVKESLSTIPLLGSMASSITYSSNPIPVINTIEETISGLNAVATGKEKGTKLKGAVRAAGAAGSLLGVAGSSQAAQLISERIKKKKGSVRD